MHVAFLADLFAAMDIDPYEVLGVSHEADLDTIKKAYRKIAFECHPDRNPDPASTERFKIATAAYEMLSSGQMKWTPGTHKAPFYRQDPDTTVEVGSPVGRVGPYMYVSFDKHVTKQINGQDRHFRIIIYGAYNARGLIGSEYNGVAILDEDYRDVLVDGIEQTSTGWFGPTPQQMKVAVWLTTVPSSEFVAFINSHPNARHPVVEDAPAAAKRKSSRKPVRLEYVRGQEINEYAGNKEVFLQSAMRVALAVGRILKKHGYTSKASINRGGPAVSGEVYAYYSKNGKKMLVMYGTSGGSEPCILMHNVLSTGWRGDNHYVRPDSTPAQIADEVMAYVARARWE